MLIPTAKQLARLYAKVRRKGWGCWEWTGATTKDGYGQFHLNGKTEYAHRVVFSATTGIDPGEHEVMHRCDNPPCCRPSHLKLGSRSDNVVDMYSKRRQGKSGFQPGNRVGPSAINAAKTHCPQGHEYTPENTLINHGSRNCRICKRQRERERHVQ